MKFLDPQEAEKFKKQKWLMFCGTPCRGKIVESFYLYTVALTKDGRELRMQNNPLAWRLAGSRKIDNQIRWMGIRKQQDGIEYLSSWEPPFLLHHYNLIFFLQTIRFLNCLLLLRSLSIEQDQRVAKLLKNYYFPPTPSFSQFFLFLFIEG